MGEKLGFSIVKCLVNVDALSRRKFLLPNITVVTYSCSLAKLDLFLLAGTSFLLI